MVGAELCCCRDSATVQHDYHAKKQRQGRNQKRKNSVVERTLRGGASRGRRSVAKSATLRICATRGAKKSKNNQECESRTHWPSVGQALLPVLFSFTTKINPTAEQHSAQI